MKRFLAPAALLGLYALVSAIALIPHTATLSGRGLVFDSRAPDPRLSSPKEAWERRKAPFKELSLRCKVFFYSTHEFQSVFQTDEERKGVRVEVYPPRLLRVTAGIGTNTWTKAYAITENLQPQEWVDFSLFISKHKEVRISLDNREQFRSRDPDIHYAISHLVVGPVDGRIADIEVSYRLWNNLLWPKTLLIVLLGAFLVHSLDPRRSLPLQDPLARRTPILRFTCAFVLAVLALGVIAAAAALLDPSGEGSLADQVRTDLVTGLRPEPTERLQYALLVFLSPFVGLLCYRLFRKASFPVSPPAHDAVASVVALLLVSLGFWGLEGPEYLYLGRTPSFDNPLLLLLGPPVLLLALFAGARTPQGRLRRGLILLGGAVTAGFIVFVMLSRVCHHNSFKHEMFYPFEAVFYPLSQVVRGKTLLVDFYNQYGLYPHLLEPLFRAVGLSAVSFSITMSLLIGASLLCLYASLRKTLSHELFAFLGMMVFLAAFYPPSSTAFFDPYFQNAPVRTLFPLVLFALSVKSVSGGSRGWRLATLSAAALGLLWNLDTGIIAFGSVLATLCFKELCDRGFRAALGPCLTHLLTAGLAAAVVLSVFSAWVFLRSGRLPGFEEMFLYQQVYYVAGYYCLPMEILHPWNLLALVYLGGILYAVHRYHAGGATLRSHGLVYFTVLGCGIFSYYQGRSHDLNLTAVAYPAVLVLLFLTAELWERLVRNRGYGISAAVYLSVMLVFQAYLLLSLVDSGVHIPGNLRRAAETLSHRPCPLDDHVLFIRSHAAPGQRIFIDSSRHMGVLHAETGTANPVDTPGFTEVILQKDMDRNLEYLESGGERRIFVDLANARYVRRVRKPLCYLTEAVSPDRRLLLLRGVGGKAEGARTSFAVGDPAPAAGPSPALWLFPSLPYDRGFLLELELLLRSAPPPGASLLGDGRPDSGDWGLSLIHGGDHGYHFSVGPWGVGRSGAAFRMMPGEIHRLKILWREGEYTFYHNDMPVDSVRLPGRARCSEQPLRIGELSASLEMVVSGLSLEAPFDGRQVQ